MKEKIAEIIGEAIEWGDNPYNDMDARIGFANKILSLLKEEGYKDREFVGMMCSTCLDPCCCESGRKRLKEWGWLHKDFLTYVMVEEKCPCESINSIHKGMPMKHCARCGGTGTISRPLTVGEVVEKARQMARIGRF